MSELSNTFRSLNVVLVAEESAGLQSLRILAASGHNIVAVMAQPSADPKSGALWNHAQRLGYSTWPAKLVKQAGFADQLREHQVDLLLNVHSLFVIHRDVLKACRIGAYNLHPGPLPERAGINVPSWSIYEGWDEHGVTLHEMVAEIDAGTIAYEARFPITATDSGMTLMSKCVRQGVPLIQQLLQDVGHGVDQVPKIEQEFSRRRYFDRSVPNEGWIDWHRPATEVVNFIRAADYAPFSSPWGAPQTQLGEQVIGIVKASLIGLPCEAEPGTVGMPDRDGLLVAAEGEWVLVKTVELDGRRVPATAAFTTGARLIGLTMTDVSPMLV